MIDQELLRKIAIFKDLDENELEHLAPYLKLQEYPKGSYILKENTVGDQFFILIKGRVKISKDLIKALDSEMASTQKALATLEGKDLPTFGENGILGQAPRNANVIAGTECALYGLSNQDFDDFAHVHTHAAFMIMKSIAMLLTQRLKSTDENLVKLATALYIAVQA
jgi:CRP-like cAMP-binding protein